jgi:hypothetical protein
MRGYHGSAATTALRCHAARRPKLAPGVVDRFLAVLLAAIGVFGTGTGWPKLIVAVIIGTLGLSAGWQIVC